MKVINIPIEPIENRYSKQWDGWFSSAFTDFFVRHETVYGCTTSGKINTGSFLDVVETNAYKTSQLLKIIQILREYDNEDKLVLFFHDLWFPGLEVIAYIRDGLGLTNLRICGCLHAGSYDTQDFLYKTGMEPWAAYMEKGWFEGIVNTIFVATEYHKKLLLSTGRVQTASKIQVTGFPIYRNEFVQLIQHKEKIVVFPHRLDAEKQPELFDMLERACADCGWQFIKTAEQCKTKDEYYDVLNRASIAVSFALQETWGIAMQEATFCGAIPICPNRLSYSEMYPKRLLYNNVDEAFKMVQRLMNDIENQIEPELYYDVRRAHNQLEKKGREAILKMIQKMDIC